ncbi:MAG: YjbH domain-containing protein [Candidatus Eisenbacteria bacterium]|nr:YjbH domain-containing protein [Candidatus Eisenbacteria bacterium]
MEPLPLPAAPSLPHRARAVALACALAALPPATAHPATDPGNATLAAAAASLGLENVRAGNLAGGLQVSYENRRWRHSTEAFGRVERAAGGPITGFEQRSGLTVAALRTVIEPGRVHHRVDFPVGPGPHTVWSATVASLAEPDRTRFEVRFPSDPGYPGPPSGRPLAPTARHADLVVGPLLDYELGQLDDPILLRVALQPLLRLNPWPGGVVRLAAVFPLYHDFPVDPLHPDADRVRPGPLALDQYAWVPGVALVTASAGYFGDNRYGGSLGLARPLTGGRVVLDCQTDVSGYVAFGAPEGVEYAVPRHWSGFGGVTWHPGWDAAVRARAARFLSGDRGVELEVRRSFRDLDIGFFGQQIAGDRLVGVRVVLPVPPFTRPPGSLLRVQPVERFAVDYHSRSGPAGEYLAGVPSREDFLRQLDQPALDANVGRFRRAGGSVAPGTPGTAPRPAEPEPVSLSGMTGFVNTPWAGVISDRGLELGYNHMPKRWAYDHRGTNDNEVYYATLGFLPHVEGALRWTVIPGLRSFSNIVPESRLTDTDYMASGRVSLLEPRTWRPGLAVGVEDVKGTRRFHSTYAVAGMPFAIRGFRGRASIGYASRVVAAARHTLDGAFGAFEVSPWRVVAAQLEYDSEKWNAALALPLPFGLRLRGALLNLQSLAFGAGFSHPL